MESKVEELQKWLGGDDERSFLSKKLEVRDEVEFGRHVVAKESVKKHETIIVVPKSYLMNYISILQHLGYWNNHIKTFLDRYGISVVQTELEENGYEGSEEEDIEKLYQAIELDELLKLSSMQLVSWYLLMAKQRKDGSFWKPFLNVLPTEDELKGVPLSWVFDNQGKEYIKILPEETKRYLQKQYQKFKKDYKSICNFVTSQKYIGEIEIKDYLWAWLACNTRCIYMKLPKFLKQENSKQNFTLVPYVDFLNHTLDEHCTISIDEDCFRVTTGDSCYNSNEQLFFSYGAHGDKILLCEYGFMLPYGINRWNDMDITSYIFKLLSPNQKRFLKYENYYGEYTITKEDFSFRTEVALAVLQENDSLFRYEKTSGIIRCPVRLRRFIDGYTDGHCYQLKSKKALLKIKQQIAFIYREKLEHLKETTMSKNPVFHNIVKACYLNIIYLTNVY